LGSNLFRTFDRFANVPREKFEIIRDVVTYRTSAEVQEKMALQLATTPVDNSVLASDAVTHNPALRASTEQIKHGRPMPIVPQMRQIWEGMWGPYQLVMSGAITARKAARRMQREAEKNIADSNL
jgi:arabinogalactan oligomer/maltooligosaccharide transport system substrate-binding protein